MMATAKQFPTSHAPWGEYVPNVGLMDTAAFERWHGQETWQYELSQGRLIQVPGPGGEHGYILSRVSFMLNTYLVAQQMHFVCSTACYILTRPGQPDDILCPDISFVVPSRHPLPYQGSYQVGAPDLVIEIASPNDTRPEVAAKLAIYFAAGVRLAWTIWPKSRTVEVWRPGQRSATRRLTVNDMLDGAEIIPGFSQSVRDIFTP